MQRAFITVDHLYRGLHEEGVRFFLYADKRNGWQPLLKNYSRRLKAHASD